MTDMDYRGALAELSHSVEAGRLRLDDGVAEQCARACDTLLVALETALRRVARVELRAAFGDFQAGHQLAEKFALLATGTETSFDRILQGHIDTVVQMRDLFLVAGRSYRDTEDANAARLTSSGEL